MERNVQIAKSQFVKSIKILEHKKKILKNIDFEYNIKIINILNLNFDI